MKSNNIKIDARVEALNMGFNPQTVENLTLFGALKRGATIAPEKDFLYFFESAVTFKEALFAAEAFAKYLASIDYKGAVTICLPNMPAAVTSFYGAARAGLNINMLHPLTPPELAAEYMEKTGSTLILLTDAKYAEFKDMLGRRRFTALPAGVTDGLPAVKRFFYGLQNRKSLKQIPKDAVSYSAALSAGAASGIELPPDTDVSEVYMHSGGTGGAPKTIVLKARQFNLLASMSPYLVQSPPEGVGRLTSFMVLPVFHGYGFCMCLHNMAMFGGSSLLIPRFQLKSTVKEILRRRPGLYVGVPAMFEKLLKSPAFCKKGAGYITDAFCGGDLLTGALRDKLNAVLKESGSGAELLEGFGLTECVTVCALNTKTERKDGTVGRPLPIAEFAVLTENGFSEFGEGELLVHTPCIMERYLNDEAATNAALKEYNGKLWLHTGDYGVKGADGFITYKQRLKRIYKYKGLNIFPSEIEQKLSEFKEVQESAAVMRGGKLTACVVTNIKETEKEAFTARVIQRLKETLPYWCVPAEIVFYTALPKTALAKTDIKVLEKDATDTGN